MSKEELDKQIIEKEIELINLKIEKQNQLKNEFEGCNIRLVLDSISYTDCSASTHLCHICGSKYIDILYEIINLQSDLIKLREKT